tara:strand:- start:689 stop:1963 length:1275 start_codon:yes stop_codon:yes gene_type:complete
MGDIMTCKINADTTDGLKIVSDTSGEIDLQIDASTKVHMASDGKVGIGTTSPSSAVTVVAVVGSQFIGTQLETDDTSKYATYAGKHYHNSEQHIAGLTTNSNGTDNAVLLGGGIGECNAATNIKLYTAANDATTTGTERMRIASDGNVGIGTGTPSNKLDIESSTQYKGLEISNGSNIIAELIGFGSGNDAGGLKLRNGGSATVEIQASGTSFLNGGALFVGKTSAGNSTQGFEASGTAFRYTAPAGNYLEMNKISGTGTMINFMVGGASKGSISIDASRVYYNTTSDYRLKENVSYTFDATTRLKQLKPCRFSWISDSDSTLQDGFLAHEAKSVVPECVLGEKDATRTAEKVIKKADGTMLEENITEEEWESGKLAGDYPNDSKWVDTLDVPDYQGIDQSKLVPLLVKTIQELEARITALESE